MGIHRGSKMDYCQEKPISANTLFHFTDSFDNLAGIFSHCFYPRYCLEDQSYLVAEHLPQYVAIPMVCFCDVPLSQVNYHTETYGYYCIGLSKEWGQEKGINPIMYALPKSYSTRLLKECFGSLYPLNPDLLHYKGEQGDLAAQNVATMLYSFFTFLKPYEGEVWKNDQEIKSRVKFYDEREWRYVPALDRLNQLGLIPVMSHEQYKDEKIRNHGNRVLEQSFRLDFSARDVKYIIVREEKEVLKIAGKIKALGSRYSQEDIELLTTRIISMQRILEDF
jgi:hypothetical protein